MIRTEPDWDADVVNLANRLLGYDEKGRAMADEFAKWRASVAGEKPPIHEDEVWCGYFKMRDRRGLNMNLAPVKRPWIACAIWRNGDGELQAERAGSPIPVDVIWPYCAKYPIPFETYQFWHANERWPDEEKAS